VVSEQEHQDDANYRDVQRWASIVAQRLNTIAPIRIDCRRQEAGKDFKMFDINMKPVSAP
jgi:hypothetical protein